MSDALERIIRKAVAPFHVDYTAGEMASLDDIARRAALAAVRECVEIVDNKWTHEPLRSKEAQEQHDSECVACTRRRLANAIRTEFGLDKPCGNGPVVKRSSDESYKRIMPRMWSGKGLRD